MICHYAILTIKASNLFWSVYIASPVL